MKFSIRLLYLYLFSAIGLLIFAIGCIRLVDLGLKVYVFHNADQYSFTRPILAPDVKDPRTQEEISKEEEIAQKNQELENQRQRQREISSSLAMLFVGAPLYFYHWRTIAKEDKKK